MPLFATTEASASPKVEAVQQNTVTVKGVVTDDKGEPIVGATVIEKGNPNNGTVTDLNGSYTLKVRRGNPVVVSYVGYVSLESKGGNATLKEDLKSLNEVVVIGFGTQKKGDVTSAISSVKSEDFLQGVSVDAGKLIQGKVAGLNITTPTGDPTENSHISLRGITTLMSSTEPLVLIDGVPGDLNTVAPEDIDAIDVLKDGSAAAIYGSRGTNGVIIITTKSQRGEIKPTLEYSGYVSTASFYKKADFLTSGEIRDLIKNGESSLVDYGYDTDWLDLVTRTPISHVHNVSIRGGSTNTSYIASVNYRNIEGVIKKSDRNAVTVRGDITHRMFNQMLTINVGVINSNTKKKNIDHYIYRQAVLRHPTDRPYDDEGNYIERPIWDYHNPVALLNEFSLMDETRNMRWHANVTLTPIKNWNTKMVLSNERSNHDYGYATTFKHYQTTANNKNATAERSSWSEYNNYLELTSTYSFSLKKNNVSVMAGYNYEKNGYDDMDMTNYNFPSDLYTYNNIGQGQALLDGLATMSSSKREYTRAAYFGRITYNYDERYLLMASIRREGSSKFGENHKWGTFPAVSVGWRINKEKFFENVKFVDDLKLRAGIGVTGTEPTDSYMSLIKMTYSGYIYSNGEWIKQIQPTSNANPDLKWEKKTEYNFGLDYSLLDGRISGSVDYYIRRTNDMLWNYSVPVPPYLYGTMIANVGKMDNRGIEVQINAIPIKTNSFQWNTSVNFSHNKNKLVSLSNDKFQTNSYVDEGDTGSPIQSTTHRIEVGKPIGNFYGYKTIDITDEGIWVLQGKDGNPKAFAERDASDRTYLGNGIPKWYVNFNNTLRYKGFDMSVSMRGAFGGQILNMQRMYYENNTIAYNRLHSAFDKVYGKAVLRSEHEYVSYYIEDGDFWKIDNVTLGYTFPMQKSFLKNYVHNLRVWFSTTNLLTITGYKGMDPEVDVSGLTPGVDSRDKYPTTRTFTLGLNITF